MTRLLLSAVAASLLFSGTTAAQSHPAEYSFLTSVGPLLVQAIVSDSLIDKVPASALKTETEDRLRKNGIRVDGKGMTPVLLVWLEGIERPPGWVVYQTRVSLSRWSRITALEPTELATAFLPVWEKAKIGHRALEASHTLKGDLMEMVDAFVKDYLAANPPKR